ncbi:hypothetical protein ACIPF8_21110 [Collimonas sp. NPDC087041]|uniref:hypothetical protein n=1 Tax=Collimonas sp. NPDC087041 TaxID=3363960 RepID=UPI00380C524D
MDKDKTVVEKTNEIGRTAAGAAGAWGGAKVGAMAGGAIGSVVPVVGNVVGAAVGGIVGGGLGWWGATSLGDYLNQSNYSDRSHYSDQPALQPDAIYRSVSDIPLQRNEFEFKDGRLQIDLIVADNRVASNLTVLQQLNGVKMDLGNTNPGGF